MSVKAILRCDGCDAVSEPFVIQQLFEGVQGRTYGWGQYKAPEGWGVFDLIGCTYCPDCTQQLWPDEKPALLNQREQSDAK